MVKFVTKKVDRVYPRSEQETVISFDREAGVWSFYSTCPNHIKRYEPYVLADKRLTSVKEYDPEGRLVALSGRLDDTRVTPLPGRKRRMTEEERERAAERLQKMRLGR